VYFFFLPKTKGKSPEEIAELFGDTLATEQLENIDITGEKGPVHIESKGAEKAV
jgi:hypothetical protein